MTVSPIRFGIVGLGNCASALLQGLHFYGQSNHDRVGLLHQSFGAYEPNDIVLASAFDIAANKVGIDASDAAIASPNNTLQFANLMSSGIMVARGPTLDGLGPSLGHEVQESSLEQIDVVQHLRYTNTQVLVSYLPVGSERAARHYAEAALEAGCAFINCMPAFIASDSSWAERFREKRLPIIGDDIKS